MAAASQNSNDESTLNIKEKLELELEHFKKQYDVVAKHLQTAQEERTRLREAKEPENVKTLNQRKKNLLNKIHGILKDLKYGQNYERFWSSIRWQRLQGQPSIWTKLPWTTFDGDIRQHHDPMQTARMIKMDLSGTSSFYQATDDEFELFLNREERTIEKLPPA